MLKKLIAMLICVCLLTSLFTTVALVSATETETIDSAYVLGDFPMDSYHIDVRQHNFKADPVDYAMNGSWYITEGDRTYLKVAIGDNGTTRAFLNKNITSGSFVVEFDVKPGSTASFGVGNDWKTSKEEAYSTGLFSGLGAAGEWSSYKAYITVKPNGETTTVSGLLFSGDTLIQSKSVTLSQTVSDVTYNYSSVGHIYIFGGWGTNPYGVDNVKIYESYEKWYLYNNCDSKTGFLAYSNDNNLWYASIIDETSTTGRKYLKATTSGYGALGAVMTNTVNSMDGYFTAEFDYMGSQTLKFATSNQAEKSTDGVALNASTSDWNSYRAECSFVDADTLSVDLYTNGDYTSTTNVELGNATEIGALYFGGWANQALDNIRVYRPASKEALLTSVVLSDSTIYNQNGKTRAEDGWVITIPTDEETGEKYASTGTRTDRAIFAKIDDGIKDVFKAEFSLMGNLSGEVYKMPTVKFTTGIGEKTNSVQNAEIAISLADTTSKWNNYKIIVNTAKETYDLYVNGTQTVFGEAYTWTIPEGQTKGDFKSIGFVRYAAGWGVNKIKITNLGFAPTGHSFVLSDNTTLEDADEALKSIKSVEVTFGETDIRNIRARAVDSEENKVNVSAVLDGNKLTVTPLEGAFAENTTYTVTVPAGYVNADGLKGEGYEVTFTTPDIALEVTPAFGDTAFAKDGVASASFSWTKGLAKEDVMFIIAAYNDKTLIGAEEVSATLAQGVYEGAEDLSLTLTDDADELKLFVFKNGLIPVLETVPAATPSN